VPGGELPVQLGHEVTADGGVRRDLDPRLRQRRLVGGTPRTTTRCRSPCFPPAAARALASTLALAISCRDTSRSEPSSIQASRRVVSTVQWSGRAMKARLGLPTGARSVGTRPGAKESRSAAAGTRREASEPRLIANKPRPGASEPQTTRRPSMYETQAAWRSFHFLLSPGQRLPRGQGRSTRRPAPARPRLDGWEHSGRRVEPRPDCAGRLVGQNAIIRLLGPAPAVTSWGSTRSR
jgi:hypothetical protein